MDLLNLFVPITKVDVEKRLVYGTVGEEIADKADEIMDYATAKPQFEAWSGEIAKATDGKSVGNIRAMHGSVAAGKLTTITFDDGAKKIEACGKIVDDNEWKKVLEGVYTGFSMGGSYARRWKDADQPHLTRYTPEVSEVSIVDIPCIPSATFEIVKADGTIEMRKFKVAKAAPAETPTNVAPEVEQGWKAKDGSFHATKAAAVTHNTQVDAGALAKAAATPAHDALAKLDAALAPPVVTEPVEKKKDATDDKKKPYGDVEYADPGYQKDKKKRYPVDTEKHIRAAWSYINKKKNAAKYDAEDVKKIKAKIVAAWKDKIDKDGPPEAADKAFRAGELAKNLYDVARLAQILMDLKWMQEGLASEAIWEGDGSPAPEHLQALIDQLGAFLVALATEETGELNSDDESDYEGDEYEILELAAKAIGLEKVSRIVKSLPDGAIKRALEKAGARHSKTDQARVQGMHDKAKDMHDTACDLGADCDCAVSGEGDGAEKLAPAADLTKVAAERDALQKVLTELAPRVDAAVTKINEQATEISTLKKNVEALEAQPVNGGPVIRGARTVLKGQDATDADGSVIDGDPVKAFKKHLATLPPSERALALMKFSLANPMDASGFSKTA